MAVLEHRTTRSGRWLRERRVRVALWIAVIEGILVVFHVIPRLLALAVAVAVVALYFVAGHQIRSDAVRQAAWIAAVSQALVVLIPVLVIVVGTLALIVVGILAAIALVLLLSDRR
jgi:hypothetical protein